MKRLFLAISACVNLLYGITLEEVIDRALIENPSLEEISHRIAANESDKIISDQFENLEVIYTQNTLDKDQAMSQKNLTLRQKLPYFGKRDSMKKVAMMQEGVLQTELESAKASLVMAIKDQAYTLWELQKRYGIICAYEDVTRQNIDLFESYTMTSEDQHMGIMSAELTLSDLRIQKSMLSAKLNAAYARLSYLAAFDVKELQIDLNVRDMPGASILKRGLLGNKSVALREQEVQKRRALLTKVELEAYPDVTLFGGYSRRENFDDYWTFGAGLSLPLYGRESYKEQEQQKLILAAESIRKDTESAVEKRFESAYLQMKSAYEVYHIVHDQALPQIEHMFELTNASISTGGDLFKYIDILVQKLRLEQKSITAVADYNRAEAKIIELSGVYE